MSDTELFAALIRENPGNEKIFHCECGKEYRCSNAVPPTIMCPECRSIILLLAKDRGIG